MGLLVGAVNKSRDAKSRSRIFDSTSSRVAVAARPVQGLRLVAQAVVFGQSIGMRVATQMPAPSNENPPPMLTMRFDCGTLIGVMRQTMAVPNYLGVSFNSLLVSGVFGDTVLVPLSVKT